MNRAAFLVAISAVGELAAAPGASDLLVRSPLPLAATPAAGGTYIDPAFGSTVVRITDERNGRRCVHAYSYWRALNADSTRLLIACDDVPMLVPFNPETGAVGAPVKLEPAIQFEGASWSRDVPAVLYALDAAGRRVLRIDVRKGAAGAAVLKDLSTAFPLSVRQLSVSDGGTVFGFTDGAGGAAIWRRTEDLVVRWNRGDDPVPVNEIQISKAGNRATVHLDDGRAYLWNLTTGGAALAPNSTSHWDLGRDRAANGDGILTGIQVRGYTVPELLAPRNVFRYLKRDGITPNWTIAEHVSARADDETRLVVSTYGGGTIDQPFEDEIILVRADGGGFVRLAHTRSCECQDTRARRYWSQPRATIDRLGRWIVWTSDLGSSSRTDVLILRVP